MKKLKEGISSRSKKSGSKAASKKKFDHFGRPRLPKGMKYRIDKVPDHPLHIGSLCSHAFGEEIKTYFGEDILGAFRNTIFEIFLNLPQYNWDRFQNYSDKNLQPTSEEVRTLDLSFFEDFEIFDSTSVVSISVAPSLKRPADENQPCVVTAAEDFDDFSTRPMWEFLRKAGLALPLSPEQASMIRKTVMFQEVSPGVMNR
ncbi:hypothetical protein FXO38_00718 [Capsicum annuum]|nr:hypothetical protein FXO37_32294 [Capsicum annuum]KAF3683579.1 hypothetical protein FXO38_00718 [Capsicum annuum]